MATVLATSRRVRMTRARRQAISGYLWISPWLIGFLAFSLGPTITAFALSLTKYDIITPAKFIGIHNYVYAVTTDRTVTERDYEGRKQVVHSGTLNLNLLRPRRIMLQVVYDDTGKPATGESLFGYEPGVDYEQGAPFTVRYNYFRADPEEKEKYLTGIYGAGNVRQDKGGRLLPMSAFLDYKQQMDGRKAYFDSEVDRFVAELVATFLRGQGALSATWLLRYRVLTGLYRFAISRGYVGSSPLPTTLPKLPPSTIMTSTGNPTPWVDIAM